MTKKLRFTVSVLALALLGIALTLGGCECSQEVDEVADEFTGAKKIEQFQDLKKDLKDIEQRRQKEAEKVRQR